MKRRVQKHHFTKWLLTMSSIKCQCFLHKNLWLSQEKGKGNSTKWLRLACHRQFMSLLLRERMRITNLFENYQFAGQSHNHWQLSILLNDCKNPSYPVCYRQPCFCRFVEHRVRHRCWTQHTSSIEVSVLIIVSPLWQFIYLVFVVSLIWVTVL